MSQDQALRDHLIELLRGGHAHAPAEQVLKDFPKERAGVRPAGCPHSAWELLEHLRLAQNDILRFSQSADHVSPNFPDGYWPRTPGPETPKHWDDSVRAFQSELAEFQSMVKDGSRDLYQVFPWGDGQTLLREAMLLADHNAYHLGQLVLVRRLLGSWE